MQKAEEVGSNDDGGAMGEEDSAPSCPTLPVSMRRGFRDVLYCICTPLGLGYYHFLVKMLAVGVALAAPVMIFREYLIEGIEYSDNRVSSRL